MSGIEPEDPVRILLTEAPAARPSASALQTLWAAGVIDAHDVVGGDIAIRPGGGGGPGHLRVVRAHGPSYFVKRAGSPAQRARLKHEALMCARLDRAGLAHLSVAVVHAAADGGILVTALDEGDRNLLQIQARDVASEGVGAAVGLALAEVHALPASVGIGAPGGGGPAVLDVARLGVNEYLHLGPAALDALAIAQQTGICEAVHELSEEGEPRCLVHGDVRPANILVGGGRPPRIRLIDWEFASGGDPCWDLGSLLGHSLYLWLDSVPGDLDEPGFGDAERPLGEIRRFVRAAWWAYADAGGPATSSADARLRTVRHAGAALLDIALWVGRDTPRLTRLQVLLLQAAQSALERPHDTMTGLLGLGAAEDDE